MTVRRVEQITAFDIMEPKIGEKVYDHGRELTFRELMGMEGRIVLQEIDSERCSTVKIARVDKHMYSDNASIFLNYGRGLQEGVISKYNMMEQPNGKRIRFFLTKGEEAEHEN